MCLCLPTSRKQKTVGKHSQYKSSIVSSVAYYREGGTTAHLRLVFIWGVQLSIGFHSNINIQYS